MRSGGRAPGRTRHGDAERVGGHGRHEDALGPQEEERARDKGGRRGAVYRNADSGDGHVRRQHRMRVVERDGRGRDEARAAGRDREGRQQPRDVISRERSLV